MLVCFASRLVRAGALVCLFGAGGLAGQSAGAADAVNLQNPPILAKNGGCTGEGRSQFSATYERHGTFDDTTWARDRYFEYLIDGADRVLDARSRSVGVNTWERATVNLETVETPQSGPFKIVIYEEADSILPFPLGTRAAFDPALIRQQVSFEANALDPDCPASQKR